MGCAELRVSRVPVTYLADTLEWLCCGAGERGPQKLMQHCKYTLRAVRKRFTRAAMRHHWQHLVLQGPKPGTLALPLVAKLNWKHSQLSTLCSVLHCCRQAVRPVDPRIHFALNCGAASCPAIKVYSPKNLDFGLAAAASAFCASELKLIATFSL